MGANYILAKLKQIDYQYRNNMEVINKLKRLDRVTDLLIRSTYRKDSREAVQKAIMSRSEKSYGKIGDFLLRQYYESLGEAREVIHSYSNKELMEMGMWELVRLYNLR